MAGTLQQMHLMPIVAKFQFVYLVIFSLECLLMCLFGSRLSVILLQELFRDFSNITIDEPNNATLAYDVYFCQLSK